MTEQTPESAPKGQSGPLRDRVAIALAKVLSFESREPCPIDYRMADAVIPLVAQAQRDADVERARKAPRIPLPGSDGCSGQMVDADDIRRWPLVTEEATRGD